MIIFEYYDFTYVHMRDTVHIHEQCKAQICEPFHQNYVFIISLAPLLPILLNKSEASLIRLIRLFLVMLNPD